MLHTLRNDEIYPYFWRRRAMGAAGAPEPFTFLDLETLKTAWKGSDRELEAELYGTPQTPHFSGWTMKRIEATLDRSGYRNPRQLWSTGHLVSVLSTPSDWSFSERQKAAAWRRGERIWAWRKGLRSKASELRAKYTAFFRPPGLVRKNGDLWLNLGAGDENYGDYLKVDLSGFQHVYDDIVSLKRIPSGSASKIYCNHVLEHIPAELVQPMLRRWRQVLKPGGVVMARMPDARQCLLRLREPWVETTEAEIERLGFPNFLAREAVREGVLDDDSCIQAIYGWSNSSPHFWSMSNQHKTLWTPVLARERFESAGFSVELAEPLGSLNVAIIARR